MDWIRANKSLAAILGVAIAGALGLGVYVWLSYSSYSDSLESLDAMKRKVAGMEKAELYPNQANLDAKEEKVSAYEEQVSNLGSVLLTLQKDVTAAPIKDTDFQGKLKQRIKEVRDSAGNKVSLPKDFAFGFDSYTRSLPTAEAVNDLNNYLDGVDAIVTAAIDSGIKSIDLLQRSELGVEKGAAAPKREPRKPAPAPVKSTKSKNKKGDKAAKPAKAPVEISKVIERRIVSLDITADQGPLQVLINTLASASLMKHFTVLRLLRIENEKQEGPPAEGKAGPLSKGPVLVDPAPAEAAPTGAPPAEGAAPGAAAPKVEVITAAKPEPADAQKVLGGESLKAHLEIDLVRFLEPAEGEASSR